MDVEIEFTEEEVSALLLLLKLGMDYYMGDDGDDAVDSVEVVDSLRFIPNRVLDRVIAKVSHAGGRAAKGGA